MAVSSRQGRAVKKYRFAIACDDRFRILYDLIVKKAGFHSARLGRLVVDVRIFKKPAGDKTSAAGSRAKKKTAGARKG